MKDIEVIYDMYFKIVYRFSLRLCGNEDLADDITAETFFRALRSLNTFRGECTIQSWLCQIAKNYYLTELKKHNKFVELDDIVENDALAEAGDFIQSFSDKETAEKIHRILHELDEPYKEVFSLRILGELSFSQIGDLFGKTDNWACVTYHRAKDKIARKLEEKS